MTHPTNPATRPVDLWAACALPGNGPEYRFSARPRRRPLRMLRRLVRALRKETR